MIALIDADLITYQAGHMSQRKNKETGELEVDPPAFACFLAKKILQGILDKVNPSQYELYLTSSDKSNFRFKIAKSVPYKGNRVAPKPVHYQVVREYLVNKWQAQVISGMEADDKLAERAYELGSGFTLCTIDKDLRMVPGRHYNWKTDEFFEVDRLGVLEIRKDKVWGTGLKWFYTQVLMGDVADNIPGLPKVGAKTAYKLLKDCEDEKSLLKAVTLLYKSKGYDNMYLMEMIDLLWMKAKDFKSLELLKEYSEVLV